MNKNELKTFFKNKNILKTYINLINSGKLGLACKIALELETYGIFNKAYKLSNKG